MNFFGHAAVASWQVRSSPGLALGAMLPDFAGMCGARIAAVAADDVARGIDLHHATDSVFHQAAPVRALFATAERMLAARGCRKGPMRAAAHVGVELLLDGVLLVDARHQEVYEAALAVEPVPVTWRERGDDARFERLHARLLGHGVPHDLRRPSAVTERVVRALANRRLLAPSPDERVAIAAVMNELAHEVEAAAGEVIAVVRAGLAAATAPRAPTEPA